MTKAQIIKEINKIKFEGEEVISLTNNFDLIQNFDKNDDEETKSIKAFLTGGFVHYCLVTSEGKGIIEFARKNNLILKEKNGIFCSDDFNTLKDARNLVLASKITGKRISLTLLRKITTSRNCGNDIVELAKKIKNNF